MSASTTTRVRQLHDALLAAFGYAVDDGIHDACLLAAATLVAQQAHPVPEAPPFSEAPPPEFAPAGAAAPAAALMPAGWMPTVKGTGWTRDMGNVGEWTDGCRGVVKSGPRGGFGASIAPSHANGDWERLGFYETAQQAAEACEYWHAEQREAE